MTETDEQARPRRFLLVRNTDVTGVSGTGVVAEGVLFSNGVVALQWTSEFPTSVVFHQRGMESVAAVHLHNGATVVQWLDEDGRSIAELVHEGVLRATEGLVQAIKDVAATDAPKRPKRAPRQVATPEPQPEPTPADIPAEGDAPPSEAAAEVSPAEGVSTPAEGATPPAPPTPTAQVAPAPPAPDTSVSGASAEQRPVFPPNMPLPPEGGYICRECDAPVSMTQAIMSHTVFREILGNECGCYQSWDRKGAR